MNEEQNQASQPNYTAENMKMPENSSVQNFEKPTPDSIINGPLLGILTVLLIMVLTGLYYWFAILNQAPTPIPPAIERPTPEMNNEPESTTAEAQVEMMQALSPSDELDAIESDLEATNLDNLDAELNAIEAELDTALSTQ